MLQINATTRIALAINPVDFRKGIDTLATYCLKHLMWPLNKMIRVCETDIQHKTLPCLDDELLIWLSEKAHLKKALGKKE